MKKIELKFTRKEQRAIREAMKFEKATSLRCFLRSAIRSNVEGAFVELGKELPSYVLCR
jgi:hypothetical protein